MDKRLDRLIEMVRGTYEAHADPGHDYAHIMRVLKTCREIGEVMGADLRVLLPAAVVHDLVNLPKDHPDRLRASELSADAAAAALVQAGFLEQEIVAISTIVREHSYSAGRPPSSLESSVLQDADRLDALGAIGLMRMITCGSRLGATYYDTEDPTAEKRERDDKRFTIDHLYTKLFGLVEEFNTAEAKRVGVRRATFMKDFVKQLLIEIER
jgi:uncharacterized protein